MKVYEGKLVSENIKIGIVAARFNEFIVSKLLSGCEDGLLRHGVKPEDISVAWVRARSRSRWCSPRWRRAASTTRSSPSARSSAAAPAHYDYVCSEVSKGVASVSLKSGIPVMFGVLTTDSIEQAIERAGTKAGNKGAECARAPSKW